MIRSLLSTLALAAALLPLAEAAAQTVPLTSEVLSDGVRLSGLDAHSSGDAWPRFVVENLSSRPRRVRMTRISSIDGAGQRHPLTLHPEPEQVIAPGGRLELSPLYDGTPVYLGVGAFVVHHYELEIEVDGRPMRAFGSWSWICRYPNPSLR